MTERMRTAACGLATMAVAVALVLVLAPLTAAGQTTDASTTPRTSWDAPDLRGLWDFRTLTPLQRPAQMKGKEFLSDEEAATFEAQILEARNKDRREDLPAFLDIEYAYNDFWWDYGSNITDDRRTALIVDPPNGRIPPLTPAAREKIRAPRQRPITERVILGGSAHGPEDLGLSERCMLGFSSGPPIVPSEYNNILQVFQTPDYVVIFTEMVHEARIVPLDGRPHISGDIRQWLGDSRGHWEGDTLVIETHRFTDKSSFSGALVGKGASGASFRLVERLRRIDEATLLYEFTVEDPEWWTAPWTAAVPWKKTEGPIFEYACHEGNRGMENLLKAARAQERAQATDDASPESR